MVSDYENGKIRLYDEMVARFATMLKIKDWARLTSEASKNHKKELLFPDIQISFQEIEDYKVGRKQLQSVETLFND